MRNLLSQDFQNKVVVPTKVYTVEKQFCSNNLFLIVSYIVYRYADRRYASCVRRNPLNLKSQKCASYL
jgi:hypothetical protein